MEETQRVQMLFRLRTALFMFGVACENMSQIYDTIENNDLSDEFFPIDQIMIDYSLRNWVSSNIKHIEEYLSDSPVTAENSVCVFPNVHTAGSVLFDFKIDRNYSVFEIKAALRTVLSILKDSYIELVTLTTDHMEDDDMEVFFNSYYPFDQSFDEMGVIEWVDNYQKDLTRGL